jgi:hypothetical protein
VVGRPVLLRFRLGTYFDEAFPATIAGTFRNGGLDGPALLTDRCGNVYRMRVERNGALVNVARSGEREYLSHACDAFAPGRAAWSAGTGVARGTFKNGSLRGPAALLCPDEPPYNGEIGRDGTVQ